MLVNKVLEQISKFQNHSTKLIRSNHQKYEITYLVNTSVTIYGLLLDTRNVLAQKLL